MHPLWLFLDTACPRAVIALVRQHTVLAFVELHEYKRHGERLAAAIESCLLEAKVGMQDVQAIAVGMGPGSFTGVRIGISHAKGLCMALQIPLVGVSSGLSAQETVLLLPEVIIDQSFTLVPNYRRENQ